MPRPKVILNLYPVFPANGFADRIARRPLGANAEVYQRLVHEWTDIIKAAERMGLWGCSAIEHHFHSEGYEVAPTPGVLNAFWAGQTSRINVGALGYVIGTWDPIRLAEETAILDHLLKGRYWVGLSRGYQSRWANVLGQHSGSVATVSDKSAADLKNREVFEERVDMLLKCWTEESVVLEFIDLSSAVSAWRRRRLPGLANRRSGWRGRRDRWQGPHHTHLRRAETVPKAPSAGDGADHEEHRIDRVLRPARLHSSALHPAAGRRRGDPLLQRDRGTAGKFSEIRSQAESLPLSACRAN